MGRFSHLYFPIFVTLLVIGAVVYVILDSSQTQSNEKENNGSKPIPEDYHSERDGWAVGTQLSTYEDFPVEEGAVEGIIVLDGDEGIHGLNDLDMKVYGANGKMVGSSAGGGPDEKVVLKKFEFYRGGTGTYRVEIQNFAGDPAIRYHLTIDIYYHEVEKEE